jgi:hypothetical protein
MPEPEAIQTPTPEPSPEPTPAPAPALTAADLKGITDKLDQFITLTNQHGQKLNNLTEEIKKGGGSTPQPQTATRPKMWIEDKEAEGGVRVNLDYDAQMGAYLDRVEQGLTQVARGHQQSEASNISKGNKAAEENFARKYGLSEDEMKAIVKHGKDSAFIPNISRNPDRPFYEIEEQGLWDAYRDYYLNEFDKSLDGEDPGAVSKSLGRLSKKFQERFSLTPLAPRPSAAQTAMGKSVEAKLANPATMMQMTEQELNYAVDHAGMLPETRKRILGERARDAKRA